MVRLTILAVFMMLIIAASLQDRSSAEREGKAERTKRFIVNGEDAIPHEFPWTIDIAIALKNGRHKSCTGSLISPRIVLTGAHCVKNLSRTAQDKFNARVVALFPGWHKNPLKEAWIHNSDPMKTAPMYSSVFALPPLPTEYSDSGYWIYDYSVIILPKPLKRNKTVQFIKFADWRSPPAKNLVCYTAGFGRITNDASMASQMRNASIEGYRNYFLRIIPNVLQKLQYKMQSAERCGELIENKWMELYPHDTKQDIYAVYGDYQDQLRRGSLICGLQARQASGFCSGDSGGPLMCRSKAGQWVLYGVVAESIGKCTDLSLFQGVNPISGWLKKMIAKYDPQYRPKLASRGDGAPGSRVIVKGSGRIRWNYRIVLARKTKRRTKQD